MKFQSPLPGSPKRLHLCSVHRTAGTRVHWPVDTCRSPLTDVQHAAALLPAPPPQQRTTPPRSPGPPRTPATRRIKASRRSNGWQATALGQVVLQRLLSFTPLVGRLTSRRTAPAPAGDTWTVTTDEEVNNAAVSFNEIDTNSVEHAETVLRTNFYGAKMLTEALLPLFRQSSATSRILNISSQLGLLNKVGDPSLKALLLDEERLTEAGIEAMVSRFLAQVKDGTWGEQGWPKVWTDYSVSKLALNAYSRLLARRLEARGVSVNCFCPGFTRTDMTRGWGKRTAGEAADVGARLALLPPTELPTGTFFKWRTPQLYSKL
ncbi:(+)-neomenthol dehydrogenase isoform X1 [Zea mays]|nr:uncharacterized protein LOC100194367 isoform X1 [Zea mays]|eukprot:XP_008661480.1 NAD(P)-binding Rossmann-fold superfamily protein isoform X1 [Zea mays]